MPIKPENAKRYPANWREVRSRIIDRAGNCCEGSPAFPDCRVPNGAYRTADGDVTTDPMLAETWDLVDGEHVTTIVLTVGHLDHTPENCADENLRAWCQRCHLNYDLTHHQQSAYATRRRGKAVGDMFTNQGDCHESSS